MLQLLPDTAVTRVCYKSQVKPLEAPALQPAALLPLSSCIQRLELQKQPLAHTTCSNSKCSSSSDVMRWVCVTLCREGRPCADSATQPAGWMQHTLGPTPTCQPATRQHLSINKTLHSHQSKTDTQAQHTHNRQLQEASVP